MAIQNWGVSSVDLTWVVKDDDLSEEHFGISGWGILCGRGDLNPLDVLNGDVSDVEANVVTWKGSIDLFVMHLD